MRGIAEAATGDGAAGVRSAREGAVSPPPQPASASETTAARATIAMVHLRSGIMLKHPFSRVSELAEWTHGFDAVRWTAVRRCPPGRRSQVSPPVAPRCSPYRCRRGAPARDPARDPTRVGPSWDGALTRTGEVLRCDDR